MGSEPRQNLPPFRCFTYSTTLVRLLSAFLLSALLVSCGSGGGGIGSPPPAPSPDFSLSVTPTNAYLQTGSSTQVTLSASSFNGFSSSIAVTVSGLPAGVTVSPSSLTLKPDTPQPVTLSASASAAVTKATVTFTGTSGALSHSAQATLAVIQPITSNTPPFRTRYARTDATTPYSLWLNSAWIVYNPPTNRFFLTDPGGNRVYALDAATETLVGSIPVPGAFGIDDTPDHSLLYVGTQIGDVYAISPATMTVTKRYLASQIGPNGFQAYSVQVMADGRLALLGSQSLEPGLWGYDQFAFWNPADNSLTSNQLGVCGQTFYGIGGFKRTPDRSKLVLASIAGDQTLCEVNENGAGQYVQQAGFVLHLAISPDGNSIVVPTYVGITPSILVYDAHTLAQVSSFSVAGDEAPIQMFVSPDSRTVFLDSDEVDAVLFAYDINTGQEVGWLPNVDVQFTQGGSVLGPIWGPAFQAMDGTGLLAGPMEEGVGFIDTTAIRQPPVGTTVPASLLAPAAGPAGGATQTTWYLSVFSLSSGTTIPATITGWYFGSQEAPFLSGGPWPGTPISATTPPGAAGPADVYALFSDGGTGYIPEGFSYGPTILEVTPNYSTADGGGTGLIYGYGFGPITTATYPPPPQTPSGSQVTVSGKAVTNVVLNSNAYGNTTPPFPLQSISYTIPPGQAGSSVDISVMNSTGTTTAHDAMTYLPAIKQYSAPGAALAQGIYDPYTDLYYFTDAAEIRVFSLADHLWQPPITIPGAQRLWGIALSPDGNKMAVADYSREVVYVLSPVNPSSIQTYPVPALTTGLPANPNPIGVAISNEGNLYLAVEAGSTINYYILNTSSGQATNLNIQGPSPQTDLYQRVVISPDDSRVFFNADYKVFSVDTATGSVSYALDPSGSMWVADDDSALSGNGSRFTAAEYFYDTNLNAESYLALNDREAMNISYLYGEKFSPDGRLLFQPTTLGIDVLDGKLGNLLDRIALPVPLSPNYDALVSDGKDNDLIAITGANGDGIAEIDLTSIPEPAPLPYSPSTATTTRSSTFNTSSTTQSTSPPEGSSAEARPRPGLRGIRHKTVQNLLRRFRQKPPASP